MFSGLLKCMRANIAAFMIADGQKLINRREIPKNAPRNKISSRTGAKTSTSSTRTTGTSVNAGTDARLDCLMECVVEHLTWETYDERIRSRNQQRGTLWQFPNALGGALFPEVPVNQQPYRQFKNKLRCRPHKISGKRLYEAPDPAVYQGKAMKHRPVTRTPFLMGWCFLTFVPAVAGSCIFIRIVSLLLVRGEPDCYGVFGTW